MRLRVQKIELVGTSRKVDFRGGLNVIQGPISTGKTSLLRLCRLLLGGGLPDLPAEVKLIPGVAGELVIRDESFQVFRPMSSSPTAQVQISGQRETHTLPASSSQDRTKETYGRWLLRKLGLRAVEVPTAPTKPESDRTLVSINDYLAYCDLPKEEIRSEVFGHRHPYKDIKRRYVFQILYGLFSVRTAELQDELKDIRKELASLEQDEGSLQRLLHGTPWQNRAELQGKYQAAVDELHQLEADIKSRSSPPSDPKMQSVRSTLLSLDQHIAALLDERKRETESVKDLERLQAQLETQRARLTRAIVSNDVLGALEFVVCPRCGSDVFPGRAAEGHCYLCLQEPKPSISRQDMAVEQSRISAQIDETSGLVTRRRKHLGELEEHVTHLRDERARNGEELDFLTKTFLSDNAERLTFASARRAELRAEIGRLKDYLLLFERRAGLTSRATTLQAREAELVADLERELERREDVEEKIGQLENECTALLSKFKLPQFLNEGLKVTIDRTTYLPVVNGRSFDSLLSEGLTVEVNIAHALAHQMMSLKHEIPLPNILLIDGISGAFGVKGLDPERIAAIYEQLQVIADQYRDQLQILVVDNRLPDGMDPSTVVLELKESDRLIPNADLAKLVADRSEGPPRSR